MMSYPPVTARRRVNSSTSTPCAATASYSKPVYGPPPGRNAGHAETRKGRTVPWPFRGAVSPRFIPASCAVGRLHASHVRRVRPWIAEEVDGRQTPAVAEGRVGSEALHVRREGLDAAAAGWRSRLEAVVQLAPRPDEQRVGGEAVRPGRHTLKPAGRDVVVLVRVRIRVGRSGIAGDLNAVVKGIVANLNADVVRLAVRWEMPSSQVLVVELQGPGDLGQRRSRC